MILKKIKNQIQLLGLEMLVVLIVFFSALIIVLSIVKNIIYQEKKEFDNEVFAQVGSYVTEANTDIMNFFTFFGGHNFLIPAYISLIIFYGFFRKNRWLALRITAVSVSSLILMFTLKYFFNRPRPLTPLLHEVNGLSFPSGHAFMSFSFFGIIIYIVHTEVKNIYLKYALIILMLIFTFFIGLSRIYLRVHYGSDVVAGFCMGFIWVVISLFVMHHLERSKLGKLAATE